jgi:fatty-acid desaturase
MFEASSKTITKIQWITGLLCFFGLFFVEVNFTNLILLIISFYTYSIIGVSLMLHRYYTHKSFEFKYTSLKWLFTFVSILSGRGSPLGWVYVHRRHHAYADTEKDPHSPADLGFKLFGFAHIEKHTDKVNIFLIKDLMNNTQLKINQYYFLIILIYTFILGIISFDLLYFTWVLPVFLIQISQNSFNYFAHTYGYRNIDTRDNSTNNIWLFPFIWGDAWHNNHHANSAAQSTKIKKFEFDPVCNIINILKK